MSSARPSASERWAVREQCSKPRTSHFASSSRRPPQELDLIRGRATKTQEKMLAIPQARQDPVAALGLGLDEPGPQGDAPRHDLHIDVLQDGRRGGVSEHFLEQERIYELVSHAPSFDLEEDAMLERGVHRLRLQLQLAVSVLRSANRPHKRWRSSPPESAQQCHAQPGTLQLLLVFGRHL